jgi:hypothetical protein
MEIEDIPEMERFLKPVMVDKVQKVVLDLFSVCSDEPTQSANPVSVHAFFHEH